MPQCLLLLCSPPINSILSPGPPCLFLSVLKYIGYYAELPLGLPKKMEDQIIADLQKTPLSKGGRSLIVENMLSLAVYQ